MSVRVSVFVGLLCLAYLLEQHLYYDRFVVPKLFQWKEVPLVYWLGAFALEFLVCLAVALRSRSNLEWLLFCVCGGAAVATIQWTEALYGMPGTAKAFEGGAVHYFIQCAALATMLAMTISALRVAGWVVRARDRAES